MMNRQIRTRSYVITALVVAAVVAGVPALAQVPQKAGECNSALDIRLGPQAVVAGGVEIPVTIDIFNGLTLDALNNDAPQDFPEIRFFPSCLNTPCVPDPSLPVTYVAGSASNTCGAMPTLTVNPAAPGDLSFVFPAPGFTLGPSAMGVCNIGDACHCAIDLRVFIPSSAGTGPFPVEARIPTANPGVCVLGNTSSASAPEPLTVMAASTLGTVALLILSLVLLFTAWRILRRRFSGYPAISA